MTAKAQCFACYLTDHRKWLVTFGLREIRVEVLHHMKGLAIRQAQERWIWLLERMAADPAWQI